jgi:integral membrane protein (TIGR01906 family)
MTDANPQKPKTKINPLVWLIRLYLVIAVPTLLVIGSVRLVMTPQFLSIEYQRPGFPEDNYGFTVENRLEYGPYGVRYLLNDADIDYLGHRTLPGALCYLPTESDCSLFTARELSHMEDVKIVTRATLTAGWVGGLLAVLCGFYLWRRVSVQALRLSLMQGSLLTLGLIAAIILLAITAWDTFFSSFHAVFFEEGTWQFFFSDTLIRLYPEQFWFDASLVVGVLTTLGAVVILIITLGFRFFRYMLP